MRLAHGSGRMVDTVELWQSDRDVKVGVLVSIS